MVIAIILESRYKILTLGLVQEGEKNLINITIYHL